MKYVVGAFALFLSACPAFAVGSSFSYEGRAFDASGNPLTSTVTFKISVRPPALPNCVLYSEVQSQDLSGSNGFFTVALNSASSTSQSYAGSVGSFEKAFVNAGSFALTAAECGGSGTTFTPNSDQGRSLVVAISTDGSTFEELPSIAMGFVPYALQAKQIDGLGSSNLVRTQSGVTAPSLSGPQITELNNLIAGTSSVYALQSGLSSAITAAISGVTTLSPVSGNINLSPATGGVVLTPAASQSVQVASSMASSNPTSGALIVGGGVGVAGDVNAAGILRSSGLVASGAVDASSFSTAGFYNVSSGGSAGSPAFKFNSGNGMFLPLTDNLAFSTAGQERLRVNSFGYVGIGTTSPTALLSVGNPGTFNVDNTGSVTMTGTLNVYGPQANFNNSTVRVTSSSDAYQELWGGGGSNPSFGDVLISSKSGTGAIGTLNYNAFEIRANNMPIINVIPTGNVGIGTNAPTTKLEVAGTTKLGMNGVSFSNMGVCTTSSVAPSSSGITTSCAQMPANTAVAVNCSPTTYSGSGSWSATATATGNQVKIYSSGSILATPWVCMWVQP